MNRTQKSLAGRGSSLGVQLAGFALLAGCAALLAGCTGGTAGDRANRGTFRVTQVSTGLGQIYPYRIRQVDSFGNPTNTIVNIDSDTVLKTNVNANNDVLPVASFDTTATLPNGQPGNQFLMMRFSHKLQIGSILSDQLSSLTNSGLTTSISLIAYNPSTESTSILQGRGFVGGYSYYNRGGRMVLVQAVKNNNGTVQVLDSEATGFPRGFTGDADLVEPNTFVFVADSDSNLTTLETFSNSVLIRIVVSSAVRDSDGKVLQQEITTATTVGADPNPPNVIGFSPGKSPDITPGNNQTGVDPAGTILVRFNKPVMPGTVGTFLDKSNLTPATGGLTIAASLGANNFTIIYYADPLNYGDLCNYRVQPAYVMPGQSQITFSVQNSRIKGLGGSLLGQTISTAFTTGDGPGIVNAPVAPEAVYIGIGGAEPGVSVVDLNGFGQGTGTAIDSRFPLNPNIGQPSVSPTLAPGTSTLDYGGAGILTLTKDSAGRTRLLRAPTVGQIADIHVGCPLDLVYNNENINVNANKANQTTPVGPLGPGNVISVAPHPNPPRLVFPPPNPGRAIFGEEPTVTSSAGPPGAVVTAFPPCSQSAVNILVTGNPFATQKGQVGLYGGIMMGVFYGPNPPPGSPPPPTPYCPYTSRQQIGHFLYVLDRDTRQVLVLNSNRFTILDTIKLSDPVSMTISPNVTRLAVTNFASSSVSFIDINPLSPTFHKVVAETRVEQGPTGIAWSPEGDGVFVVSSGANAMTILSGLDYSRRKTVTGFLNNPIEVSVTPRYAGFGNGSAVFYAYVLNGNGTVAIYESGPDGVNGIGFNDIIGTIPNLVLKRPRTIKLDYISVQSGIYIGHADDSNLGTVSRVELTSSPNGVQPINGNLGGFQLPPTFRQKEWSVTQRFGGSNPTTPIKDSLSGNSIIDMTFDEMYNTGHLPDFTSVYQTNFTRPPMGHSGKGSVKAAGGGASSPFLPKLVFVALSDVGKVDVFEFGTGRKIKTIDVPGVSCVSTYWRQ